MSTPNFALKNASRYFVFGTPVYYTQEDIDECGLDQDLLGKYDEIGTECNYQADKENVAYELQAKGWNAIDGCDNDCSYPTSFFAEKTKTIDFVDTSVDVTVKAGYTSGYYEAANFDWFAEIHVSGLIDGWHEEFDYESDELEAEDVIRDNWYDNKGLSTIHAARVIKKIEAIIDELKNEAELAFSMYCDVELYCDYICSNGEAGYSKTGKRFWQEEEQKKKIA